MWAATWAISTAVADHFPQDVLELQGYLTGDTRVAGVKATPGHETNVPLYILGSSLFGAQLAASRASGEKCEAKA